MEGYKNPVELTCILYESGRLLGSLLLAGNGDLLASQCPSIALGVLASARQTSLVTFPSVALDVFQSLDGHLVEPTLPSPNKHHLSTGRQPQWNAS